MCCAAAVRYMTRFRDLSDSRLLCQSSAALLLESVMGLQGSPVIHLSRVSSRLHAQLGGHAALCTICGYHCLAAQSPAIRQLHFCTCSAAAGHVNIEVMAADSAVQVVGKDALRLRVLDW